MSRRGSSRVDVLGKMPPDGRSVTSSQSLLDAFLLDRRIKGCRPRTLEHYGYSLRALLSSVPGITPQAVFQYLDDLRQRVAPASYRSFLVDIRAFLRWLHEEGHLPEHIRVRPPKLPDTLPPTYSHEEIDLILKKIDRRTWNGQRDYCIIHVLWDCGLRAEEVCSLRRVDVGIGGARILHVMGKGGKERLVGYSQTTARLVKAWMRTNSGLPTDYLFPSRKGPRLRRDGLYQMITRRTADAGIKVRRAVHAWRHTYAVQAYEHGADIADLKDNLGHTSYQTVDIYRRATARARQQRHDKYSPVQD